ncbi:MAG TPA: hypothetical protein VMS17_27375 [Gemmataceae bacterium]|nr:hypothetical protein [Gemmataceae bacterium]
MKWAATLILALALTVTGCVELPMTMDAKPPPSRKETPPTPAEPPVLPEQVSDGNAHAALDALRRELDRAAVQPTPLPTAAPGSDR